MTSKCDRNKKIEAHEAIAECVTDVYTYNVFTANTLFQTRGTYKLPGGLEGSVDTPVVEGTVVGVALEDDPVEGGVSKAEYGVAVEPIEPSAVVGKSSVTRHTGN